MGILIFGNQHLLARQMDSWQVLPRPERLTELYFVDPYQADRAQFGRSQTVAFTIHNLEHQATTYTYTLSAMSEDDLLERPLASGSIKLTHDQARTTTKAVALPESKGRLAVKVTVEYKGIAHGNDPASTQKQSIHYWTTVAEKPSGKQGQ